MKQYTTGQFGKLIGKHKSTLIYWEKKGYLVPHRTPSNRRYYTDEHLKQIGMYELFNWDVEPTVND